MKFKKGDKVTVITGKEKGKSSTVTRVLRDNNKVVLEGLNMMKKHIKAKKEGEKGSMIDIAMPIDASNVKLSEKKVKATKEAKPKAEKTEKKAVAKKKTTKKAE